MIAPLPSLAPPINTINPPPPPDKDAFVRAIRERKDGLLADALLNDMIITTYGPDQVIVYLKNPKQKHYLSALRVAVAQLCGPKWDVIVTEDCPETPQTLGEVYQDQHQQRLQELRVDAFLKQALDTFQTCVLKEIIDHD